MACTDAQSLYDHLRTDGSIGRDRIFALDAAALREFFSDDGGRNAAVKWIPSKLMVSDGLTKYLPISDLMISVMSSGQYSLFGGTMVPAQQAATREAFRDKQKAKKKAKKQSESEAMHCNFIKGLRKLGF